MNNCIILNRVNHKLHQNVKSASPKCSSQLLSKFLFDRERPTEFLSATMASFPYLNKATVTPLNSHDVLFGRGTGPSQYVGNKAFRALVEEFKEEYNDTTKHKLKRRIAKQIYIRIHSLGGRFMKQVETDEEVECVITDCEWEEVDEKAGLEKIKQALRQHRENKRGAEDDAHTVKHEQKDKDMSLEPSAKVITTEECLTPPAAGLPKSAPFVTQQAPREDPVPSQSQTLSQPRVIRSIGPSAVDSRILLFQEALLRNPQQQQSPPLIMPMQRSAFQFDGYQNTNFISFPTTIATPVVPSVAATVAPPSAALQDLHDSVNVAAAAAHQRYLADNHLYSRLRDFLNVQSTGAAGAVEPAQAGGAGQIARVHGGQQQIRGDGSAVTTDNKYSEMKQEASSQMSSQAPEDDELSAFLFSALEEPGQPRLTLQELEAEWASMTDEEKALALSDVFGKMCEYNTQHKNKKARKDLDQTSIDFLVRQMKLQLEAIPDAEKPALLEAQERARAEEFSNARMVRFLRCDGMNAKVRLPSVLQKLVGVYYIYLTLSSCLIEQLAARRFVNYWEGRREVFGPERYILPITLSEALCGDSEAIRALETGILRLLPNLDLSGRQLLFLEPRRHTKSGYTVESLVSELMNTCTLSEILHCSISYSLTSL